MSTPTPMRTVGHYELLDEIGRGGMAIVYLAREIKLDRLVALKELNAFHADDPASARRFLNESRLAGSLTHANIVTVYEYFEHERLPYISMEYARRGSLRPLMDRLTPPQATGVLVSVLNGLICAEEHGVVHRDLKPENLMLGDDGNVKIADFGIARAINRVTTLGVHTATGTTVGTPDYMAPEQASGQAVTSETDRYSLGVIAYELFTGRKPFQGDSPISILFKHVNAPLPPPQSVNPELDAGLADWTVRLLEKEPEDRIPSARQALDELEDIAIRLHGPRWRRLAVLPEALTTEPERRLASKVLVTFDGGQEGEAAVDEPSEPLGPNPDSAPATTGAGKAAQLPGGPTAQTPVEDAPPPSEVDAGAAFTQPPEADGATIPPRDGFAPAPPREKAEAGAGRVHRIGERATRDRRGRAWWLAMAALFLVAGGAVAAASLLSGGGGHAPPPAGSTTTGVSPPPKRLDVGRYRIELPRGWSCDGQCKEHPNSGGGFRLALTGPAGATAVVDRYVIEPNITLRDVRGDVLKSVRPQAVGEVLPRPSTGPRRWDYSYRTGVRQGAGSIRMFTGAAYNIVVLGYPQTPVEAIDDEMAGSLRPKQAKATG